MTSTSEHEDWVKKIVSDSGVPMLIEILSDRVHYWIAKVDLAAIDGQGRPIENPTVQIDVESRPGSISSITGTARKCTRRSFTAHRPGASNG